MCGILCLINRNKADHPRCFDNLESDEKNRLTCESSDVKYIRDNLILRDMERLKLSEVDKRKIENLEELRGLHNQLIVLKNNIKNNAELEKKRIIIEDQISTMTSEEHETKKIDEVELNFENLICKVASRGPDFTKYLQFYRDGINFQLFSSILSLRRPFTSQPVIDESWIVQFNGELYNEDCLRTNDTEFISLLLKKNLKHGKRSDAILRTIGELDGEFAILLLDLIEMKCYFGRDSIGKRSLVYALEPDFIVCSVPPDNDNAMFQECKNEMYQYDLKTFELTAIAYDTIASQSTSRSSIGGTALDYNPSISEDHINCKVQELYRNLKASCLLRQDTIHPTDGNDHSFGILFSGGLDCTILASLLSECVQDMHGQRKCRFRSVIYLISVAFEHPRSNLIPSDSPDRKLGKKSWFNICKKYNSESLDIKFIEVDVSYELWLVHKRRVVSLMYPSATEMDLSIAIAFYFASECKGRQMTLKNNDVDYDLFLAEEKKYILLETHCTPDPKVLFSGLGADELFAGYSRHEAIFNSVSSTSTPKEINDRYLDLSKSLRYDIDVIHHRNLGRDDRVMACWGKELRYPYLDIDFINYVMSSVEPNLKLTFGFQQLIDKKNKVKESKVYIRKYLLRRLADYLDLSWVRDEQKRAIQFGAKSAKLELGQNKTKGTDSLRAKKQTGL